MSAEGPRDWQMFYKGYRERFVQDCEVQLSNGKRISVVQAPSASASAKRLGGKLDKASDPALTGTTVWDGSLVLAQYLTATQALRRHGAYPSGGASPATCVELGAGTGVVSLALAACGCARRIIATDLPDVLPHLQHCVSRNRHSVGPPSSVQALPLRWGHLGDVQRLQALGTGLPVDLVVGADLVYYTFSAETPHSALLLTALGQLAGSRTAIFLALSLHHNPEEVESFLERASADFQVGAHCLPFQLPSELGKASQGVPARAQEVGVWGWGWGLLWLFKLRRLENHVKGAQLRA
jgi:predicted nicotinamide N-methyase